MSQIDTACLEVKPGLQPQLFASMDPSCNTESQKRVCICGELVIILEEEQGIISYSFPL